jgi:acetylornithine deacetylase/succinyl-diaminopimelate desuccinylase-like protein
VTDTDSAVAEYVRSHSDAFRDELFDYLEIPSVSTESEHRRDVTRCAEWVAARVEEAGVERVEVVETDGHPIVLGEHDASPGAPTLLVYGHYDVQPEDPLEEWTSPPFEATVRDGRVYARGATDNKGQNHMHLKALEACARAGDGIPVNLRLVIEGEEEVGSAHLEAFLEENRDRLECDGILLSDTQMPRPDLPAVVVGLRGLAYLEVTARGPGKDLHSGVYGGPVDNPANALASIIGRLKDEDGRVTVPGFYDDVRPITDLDRRQIERIPFDEEEFRRDTGVPALGGEDGYGPLELLGYRPTLDVNGLLSGFTGEGAKTVLPSEARAKISMRLVPDQDPEEVAASFRRHVRELAPDTVELEVRDLHGGRPWAAQPEGPLADAALASLEEAFGNEPVLLREGGSIPIIPLFAETFGVQVLPIGFALPGCNLHAPDEWLDLEVYRTGIEALARLYRRLGQVRL